MVLTLIGEAGSGKDSVADHIVSRFPNAVKMSFAAPLKKLCCEQFGWDPALLLHEDNAVSLAYKEEQDPNLSDGWTRRRVLQHVGTEGFRTINPTHWTSRCVQAIKDYLLSQTFAGAPNCIVLITDARFANEVEALRFEFNATTVRVVCSDRITATAASDHVSETELATCWGDYTLEAKFGELPKLFAAAERLVFQLHNSQ